MAHIISTSTAHPPHQILLDDAIAALDVWLGDDPELLQKARSIFRSSAIVRRHSALALGDLLVERSLEERNEVYLESSKKLSVNLVDDAIRKAAIDPTKIGAIVSTCCTGYSIPAIDCHLINQLGLSNNTRRIPLLQLGCSAGIQALSLGSDYVAMHPTKFAVVLCLEYPTMTLILRDRSLANIVSASIFGDGGACFILGGKDQEEKSLLEIKAARSHLFPETEYLMGFDLCNEGFKMVLDRDVPRLIGEMSGNPLWDFVEDLQLDLKFAALHPGGNAILKLLNERCGVPEDYLRPARKILTTCGNMSSATILFVIAELIKEGVSGDGIAAAFGPGFCMELLQLSAVGS